MNGLIRIGSVLIVSFVFLIFFFLARIAVVGWEAEEYCYKHTKKIEGPWNKQIPATEYEKKFMPSLVHDGKIYAQTHEIFDCEHKRTENFKYFILF